MKHASSNNLSSVLQPGNWFCWDGQPYEITRWGIDNVLTLHARAHLSGELREFTLTDLFSSSGAGMVPFAPTRAEVLARMTQQPTKTAAHSTAIDATSLPSHLLKQADAIISAVESMQRHRDAYTGNALNQKSLDPATSGTQGTASATSLTATAWMRQGCESLSTPIALSTYYKYRHIYETHRGLRTEIAAKLHRTTFGKTKLTAQQQHFVETIVQSFYKTNPPMRLQTVYAIGQQVWQHTQGWWVNIETVDDVERAALTERLLDVRKPIQPLLTDQAHAKSLQPMRLLSRSRFYTYVKQLVSQPATGSEIQTVRYGRAEWEKNIRVFDQFASTATLPLQYVFADHYKLDVLHVDDVYRKGIGRLWLTVLIDAYSRAVLGIYLGYEDPSIVSIQSALRNAIWPKSDLGQWGIDQAWETFGVPQRLFVDNAWAHLSYSLEDLIRALSCDGGRTQMELVFRPPYVARYGGLVERLFGNISGQIRELLPGTLLQPDQRHWHDASKNACLLYRDIARIVRHIIVGYMHTPHSELGQQTPHERWLAGLRMAMPNLPALTPELERSFWRMYPQTRRVTHHGIGLFGMHFWNSELGTLQGLNLRGQKPCFHVRYNPLDISRLAVFEQGTWLGDVYPQELRLADGSYEPVSLWELNMAKEWASARSGSRALRTHSWLVHILEARELIERRQSEQAVIRRKSQQIREHRNQQVATRTRAGAQTETDILLASSMASSMASPMTSPMTVSQADPRAATLSALKETL